MKKFGEEINKRYGSQPIGTDMIEEWRKLATWLYQIQKSPILISSYSDNFGPLVFQNDYDTSIKFYSSPRHIDDLSDRPIFNTILSRIINFIPIVNAYNATIEAYNVLKLARTLVGNNGFNYFKNFLPLELQAKIINYLTTYLPDPEKDPQVKEIIKYARNRQTLSNVDLATGGKINFLKSIGTNKHGFFFRGRVIKNFFEDENDLTSESHQQEQTENLSR